MEILGGSSDHTIVDVTNSGRAWKPGDILRFRMYYMPLLYAFSTRHITIRFTDSQNEPDQPDQSDQPDQ